MKIWIGIDSLLSKKGNIEYTQFTILSNMVAGKYIK